MKAKIKKVKIGANYQGKIYDYWIHAILPSGKVIELFDFKPFDLRDRIGQTIDLLVSVELMHEVGINPFSQRDYEIIGEFVELALIQSESWGKTVFDDKGQTVRIMIRTEDGMLYINKDEFESHIPISLNKIDKGAIIGIRDPSFMLLAVKD